MSLYSMYGKNLHYSRQSSERQKIGNSSSKELERDLENDVYGGKVPSKVGGLTMQQVKKSLTATRITIQTCMSVEFLSTKKNTLLTNPNLTLTLTLTLTLRTKLYFTCVAKENGYFQFNSSGYFI